MAVHLYSVTFCAALGTINGKNPSCHCIQVHVTLATHVCVTCLVYKPVLYKGIFWFTLSTFVCTVDVLLRIWSCTAVADIVSTSIICPCVACVGSWSIREVGQQHS